MRLRKKVFNYVYKFDRLHVKTYFFFLKGSIEETLVSRLGYLGIKFDEKNPRKAFVDECLNVLIKIQTTLLQVCSSGGI